MTHSCEMDEQCMPECCAQWISGGGCANTGGGCPFRRSAIMSSAHETAILLREDGRRDRGDVTGLEIGRDEERMVR